VIVGGCAADGAVTGGRVRMLLRVTRRCVVEAGWASGARRVVASRGLSVVGLVTHGSSVHSCGV
jgi:hypothetical protein